LYKKDCQKYLAVFFYGCLDLAWMGCVFGKMQKMGVECYGKMQKNSKNVLEKCIKVHIFALEKCN
jgi:hypothetical protein